MPSQCTRCLDPVPDGASLCPRCASGGPQQVAFPDASGGAPPRVPERWKLQKFLGAGGMGRVYLARDMNLETDVALKFLAPDLVSNDAAMRLIRREANILAQMRKCRGILTLYDLQESGGEVFLVMEYAPGGSLLSAIARGRGLSEDVCRSHGADIAEALAFAHKEKYLHRDMKPHNVLLGEDGRPRVADFGLSRALSDSVSQISSEGAFVGTAAYIPPEVLERQPMDHRSDLYSLGCTLYEMATGAPPYAGTFEEIAFQKRRTDGKTPDPREVRDAVSESYAAVVRSLMARDPADRLPDGKAAAAALRGERGVRPPGKRLRVLFPGPVEPAVRGLPTPAALPPGVAKSLPEGFVEHEGRIWCLKDGAEMAWIPAGEFLLGSDHGEPDERPQRRIRLSGYLADRHEVTVFQYRQYCQATKSPMPPQPPATNDRHPVVNVTWEEAMAYARWAGKALPTEAQWERAARGDDGRDFPWGNDVPDEGAARFHDPSEKGITAVGGFPTGISPWGCLDMVGNAWEWVFDWYASDAYAKAEAKDPAGPVEGKSRVMRGGAWNDLGEAVRVTKRRRSRPDSRYDFVGFRCVRDL